MIYQGKKKKKTREEEESKKSKLCEVVNKAQVCLPFETLFFKTWNFQRDKMLRLENDKSFEK